MEMLEDESKAALLPWVELLKLLARLIRPKALVTLTEPPFCITISWLG